MLGTRRTFDLRTASLIGGAALLGAAWAVFNLSRVGWNGATGQTAPLVWAVFATPFFTFWGWFVARRHERWLAAFVCFCIYFFSVFIGARLELLVLGTQAATDSCHELYFRLTLIVQVIACVVVAAQRASTHGTISTPTDA